MTIKKENGTCVAMISFCSIECYLYLAHTEAELVKNFFEVGESGERWAAFSAFGHGVIISSRK